MEHSNKKNSPLLYLIMAICLLNLIGTLYLVCKTRSSGSTPLDAGKAPLPAGLDSRESRNALFDQIKSLYNAKDFDGLYQKLDEAVHIQISIDKMSESLTNLYSLTGDILSGAYGSYEVHTGQGGMRKYTLYYPIQTNKGQGVLQVNVFQQGQEKYRIAGFRIIMQ